MLEAPARRYRVLALVVGLLIFLTGCEIQLAVEIDVAPDGSGTVTAAIALDEDAQARLGDVDGALRVADLEATGWGIAPPEIRPDGRRWYSATKSFSNPDQLQDVLDELAGSGTIFEDFEINRVSSHDETSITLTGTVDLTGGVELFSDPALAALLDEPPIGVDVETIEEEIGDLDQAVTMRVVVNLPDTESGQTFTVPLGEEAEIEAVSKQENQWGRVLRWVGYALLALFVLALLLAVASFILDRRYDDDEEPRRPAPVRDLVPVAAEDSAVAPVVEPEEEEGPAQLRLVIVGADQAVFGDLGQRATWLAGFARERGSVAGDEEISEAYRQGSLGDLTSAEIWERLRVPGDPEELDAAFLSAIRSRPAAKEFVREMHRRSLPVAVVANDVAEWSHQLRSIHGFDAVDYWIASADLSARAPDPAFFEGIRRETGVPFSRALVIMADVASLDTARSLGMITALWVDRRPEGDDDPGHPVVTGFSDFFRRRRPEPAGSGRRRRS